MLINDCKGLLLELLLDLEAAKAAISSFFVRMRRVARRGHPPIPAATCGFMSPRIHTDCRPIAGAGCHCAGRLNDARSPRPRGRF
jgi:hypothetical protein